MFDNIDDRQEIFPAINIDIVFTAVFPCLLMAGVDFLARDTFPVLSVIPQWFILVAAVATIVVAVSFSLAVRYRWEVSSILRVNIFVYLFVAGIFVFLLRDSLMYITYPALIVTLGWIVAFSMSARWKEYIIYMYYVKKRRESSGNSKEAAERYPGRDSYLSLKRLRSMINVILFLFIFAVALLHVIGIALRIVTLIFCVVVMFAGVIVDIIITICIDEYRYYNESFGISGRFKQRRIALFIIVLLLCLLLVVPFSRDDALFSPADIAGFFSWLLSLLPAPRPAGGIPDYPGGETLPEGPDPFPFDPNIEGIQTGFDLSFIIEILGISILILLGILLLWFLFKPLFEKGISGLSRGIHPFRLIRKKLKALILLIGKTGRQIGRTLRSLFRPREKRAVDAAVPGRQDIGPKRKRIGIRKTVQKNRVLRAFSTLIKWGCKRRIGYHPSLGPKEYIISVIERRPEMGDALIFIADTFEEAVFSDHIMDSVIINRYIRHVHEVIRSA